MKISYYNTSLLQDSYDNTLITLLLDILKYQMLVTFPSNISKES